MTDDPQAITFRFPAEVYERLRKRAFDERRAMNALVVEATRDYLDRTDRPTETPGEQGR